MGVDAGDFDNDGDEDRGHRVDRPEQRSHVNDGSGSSSTRARVRGSASKSAFTGFGVAWLDVDNDDWLDLLTVTAP
jgi:hypothetical protein